MGSQVQACQVVIEQRLVVHAYVLCIRWAHAGRMLGMCCGPLPYNMLLPRFAMQCMHVRSLRPWQPLRLNPVHSRAHRSHRKRLHAEGACG